MKKENHKLLMDKLKKANELISDIYQHPDCKDGNTNKVCGHALLINKELAEAIRLLNSECVSKI